MSFESPDISTFKQHLEASISAIKKHKAESHAAIKIQSLMNLTVYVLATRFLEGSIKHIVYNCAKMRGDDSRQLLTLENDLKKFNNPEFKKIQELILDKLNFDITLGINMGFESRDITFLNEIVINRHKNVHASYDSSEWYNQNKKDLSDFEKEFEGIINIITFLDRIHYDVSKGTFKI